MQRNFRDEFPMRGESGRRDWIDSTQYSVIQRFFLARLEHLVALRRTPELFSESWHLPLINRAVYSTYRDCVALGLAEEARAVLHGEERTPHSSPSA